MRVVLDTNIFISALVSTTGTPAALIDAWLEGAFALVSHQLQLDELREVTRREKVRRLIRPVVAGRLVNQIVLAAEIPKTLLRVERSRDPRDDFLLALCQAGRADRLATGDKHDLLALDRHEATRIVTAAALARELGLG